MDKIEKCLKNGKKIENDLLKKLQQMSHQELNHYLKILNSEEKILMAKRTNQEKAMLIAVTCLVRGGKALAASKKLVQEQIDRLAIKNHKKATYQKKVALKNLFPELPEELNNSSL